MARYGSTVAGMGYVGYPARIFFEMTNYGRGTQRYVEKMVILEKWYSHLRAYLPVLYEKKQEEFVEKIHPKIYEVFLEIEKMNEMYDPTFEDLTTRNPDEKTFCLMMRGVFERLDQITALTKVIDKQGLNDEEVFAG